MFGPIVANKSCESNTCCVGIWTNRVLFRWRRPSDQSNRGEAFGGKGPSNFLGNAPGFARGILHKGPKGGGPGEQTLTAEDAVVATGGGPLQGLDPGDDGQVVSPLCGHQVLDFVGTDHPPLAHGYVSVPRPPQTCGVGKGGILKPLEVSGVVRVSQPVQFFFAYFVGVLKGHGPGLTPKVGLGQGGGRGIRTGMERTDCIIVGGGLVGSLLAITLARRGQSVHVFEKRPDLRKVVSVGRSINLVVTSRGVEALRRVGLDKEALALTVPVFGRMMHSRQGELTYQPYGREAECNYSIGRGALNGFLLSESEKLGVRWHFEHTLAELTDGMVRFENGAEWEGSWIFGCDGAGSQVRTVLQKRGAVESTTEFLSHGYKELEIPAGPNGAFLMEKTALHIWPRGDHMLMALPNQDGSFTVTLYLDNGEFSKLESASAVGTFFESHYPDALPLMPDLWEQWQHHPASRLGTVRTRPWHEGNRVLLLGDAAHAIVPFFGQGMNSGFEDVLCLDQQWERLGEGETVPRFLEDRRRNANAIADMALENFVEMRDRVGDTNFLRRKRWERELEARHPRAYRSRYGMVTYTLIPYHVAQEVGQFQMDWLDAKVAHTPEDAPIPWEAIDAWVKGDLARTYREKGIDQFID